MLLIPLETSLSLLFCLARAALFLSTSMYTGSRSYSPEYLERSVQPEEAEGEGELFPLSL